METPKTEKLDTLVRAAQLGKSEAFGHIVSRYQSMAYASAYAQTGDFHLAQDAAQEAFIEAFLCLDTLREPAAFPAWFRRFVVKHSDRQLRKSRPLVMDPAEIQTLPSDLPNPEVIFTQQQTRHEVRDAINALPSAQREAIALFYLEGYSQKEISKFLGVSVGTVGKRLYDARKGLKKRMENMVKETLQQNQPDESFATRVRFFITLKQRDIETASTLLDADASLAQAEAGWWTGADQNVNPGTTPMTWATSVGDKAMVDLLLKHGVDINTADKSGNTPLLNAVMQGQHQMAQMLLDRKANVEARGWCKHTPLHRAVMRGDEVLVELLLNANAEIEAVDEKGYTATDWAALKGHQNLVNLLVKRGAKKPSVPVRKPLKKRKPVSQSRSVIAGASVLGRMIDADCTPIDGEDPISDSEQQLVCGGVKDAVLPILETGIKAVDLFAPFKRGGHIGVEKCIGVGVLMLGEQIARNFIAQHNGRIVFVGFAGEDPAVKFKEWREFVCDGKLLEENTVFVLAREKDAESRHHHVVETGLTIADGFHNQGHNVLLIVEAGLAEKKGIIPFLRSRALVTPEAAITTFYWGCQPSDLNGDTFGFLDAVIALSGHRAKEALYPAIDSQRSRSSLLSDNRLEMAHKETVAQVRQTLVQYDNQNLQAAFKEGRLVESLIDEHIRDLALRARRLALFLTQPYHGTESWMGKPGETVALRDTLEGCRQILDGCHDDVPLGSFGFIGSIDQVQRISD